MTDPVPIKPAPRGIRNNNPGNIRWGDDWQGLVPPNQRTDPSFCQFTDAKYGIRAMAKLMLKYATKPGQPGVAMPNIDTVQEIISRWAPPNENNTGAYIASVALAITKATGKVIGGADHIDVRDKGTMKALLKAIIAHENGVQPYSDSVIEDGMTLAGV